MRGVLRQLIMRPRDVAAFSDDVNEVVADLVVKVRKLRSQQPDGVTVLNVSDLFFKFAMEGECVNVSEEFLLIKKGIAFTRSLWHGIINTFCKKNIFQKSNILGHFGLGRQQPSS